MCVGVRRWVAVGVAVFVTPYACVPVLSLSFVCLLQCVFVTGPCGSVSVSGTLVCLYLSLCVTVSVPRCVTIHPGVTALLTAQATGGRVGPSGARAGAHPIPPSLGQAGRLFAVPAPGKHRDPEPKGHLPHLRPAPQPAPDWAGPNCRCPQAGDVPCPSPPPLVTSLPKPQPGPRPVSVCLLLCARLSGWLLASLFLSAPHPLTWVSLALPFSSMTVVCILSLPFSLLCLPSEV